MSPLLRFWRNIREVKAPRHTPTSRRPTKRFRPQLDQLEDRLAPATLTWTGGAGQSWSNPGNWAQGTTPYITPEADDLIFPRGGVPEANKITNHDLPGNVDINSITFQDGGYFIVGGDIRLGGITSSAPGGTNEFLNHELNIGRLNPEPTSVEIRSNNTLRVQSNIVGGQLVKVGMGTLDLFGKNSYRAGLALVQGTVIVGSDTALGTGKLQVFGGTLDSSSSVVTLANPVDVLLDVNTIRGDITFTGTVQLSVPLTVDTDGLVEFTDVVFGPGMLTKKGTGSLSLTGNNTYEGGMDMREGFLTVNNDNALGHGLLKFSAGTLLKSPESPATITLPNQFVVSGGTIVTQSGNLTFTGNGEILAATNLIVDADVDSVVRFSGALIGLGALTKTGGGQMFLSGGLPNNYTGTTTVNDGTLTLDKPAGVNAIAGPLNIGDGLGLPKSAVVSLAAANQVADTPPVRINTDGLFKKNNNSEKINVLTGAGRVTGADPPTLTVAFDDITATFEGEISGPGFVVKEGTGTWILAGANTYEGGTIVAGGTLLINGSVTSPVTVNAGATLGGTGTTGPVTLTDGAAISPGGAAPGIQRVQDLAFSAGSSYVVQLNGPDAGTGYDQLDVSGSVSLNGATLAASLGFSPAPGHSFVVVNNDGTDAVVGTFAGLPHGAVVEIGGVAFHIYYDRGDGNDVALVSNVPPAVTVPGDQTAFQNVDLPIAGISVADPDDANLVVTLQVSHGTMSLGTVAGLTVVGNGTASVSLSGSQVALNAALAGLIYQPLHNYSGLDDLMVTASDGLALTTTSVAIRVKSLAEQAADLSAQVIALRDAGVLNKGQANSLLVKLKLKNNRGDIGRVQSFLNQVAAFLRAGILSPTDANPLLESGNVLLIGLKRR